MVTEMPIVVYHVAAMGNWKDVVVDQLTLLRDVELLEIRVTHVGQDKEWLVKTIASFGIKATLVRSDENTDHYETLAMIEIERLVKEERITRPILYFHTKGVSNPHSMERWTWRKLMEEYVIRRWRENLELLKCHDVIGVNWIPGNSPHFSGNFWIANPSWIQKLPNYTRFHHAKKLVRYSCEMWIGSASPCRYYSLACREQPFWEDNFPFISLFPSLKKVSVQEKLPLTIITACSRPRLLYLLERSITKLRDHFQVTWIVVLDSDLVKPEEITNCYPDKILSEPSDKCGMRQKNRGVKEVGEGWIYFLDDDNLIHPQFSEVAISSIQQFPNARAFVFGQNSHLDQVRLVAGPIQWSKVDAASVLIHSSIVGDAEFKPYPGAIGDDFIFIRHIYENHPERFYYIQSQCTYYNALADFQFPDKCPVPLLQNSWEFREACKLIRPDHRFALEIGSLYGGTLWHWLQRAFLKIGSIDLPPTPYNPWWNELRHGQLLEESLALWASWDTHNRLAVLKASSTDPSSIEWAKREFPQGIDWLLIDGDHSYEGVRSDWEKYSPLVNAGGYILLHDVIGIPGVARLWNEIIPYRDTITISSIKRECGIGVVSV